MKNRNKIIILLIMFTIIFTTMGGSLAAWNYQTLENQKTNVVFTTEKGFSCAADGGGTMESSSIIMMPTTCTNSEQAIQREVTVTTNIDRKNISISMDLWLDINDLGTELSNSQNFKYALTTEENSCTEGVVAEGNFNGKQTGDQVLLLDRNNFTSTSTETYYLYIWLDKEETNPATANQTFNFTLNGTCWDKDPEPAEPELDDGMIPVTISADGVVTTISKDDDNWYDYSNQEWANIVLVTDSSRSNYKGTTNKTVSESDILAYYVWIPRYKYKIWTTTTSSTGNEQEIDIIFEPKNAKISKGTTIGSYRTHPAFIWDEDSDGVIDDGETIGGIWVGKFETSTDTSNTCYTSPSVDNCNNANQSPRIVPNVETLRYQNVSNQFATSRKLSTSDNIYGINSTTMDSHMMKNSEWGAVAYLSHTKYGINQEIYINNSSNKITGRSGGAVGGSQKKVSEQFSGETSTNNYNAYGYYTWIGQAIDAAGTVDTGTVADSTLGTYASTTGNTTGVYDISGGTWERTMGNYNSKIGYAGFNEMPKIKYYELYSGNQFIGTYDTNVSLCTLATCGGHALSETANWYGDGINFLDSNNPWFLRGGGCEANLNAGAYNFGRSAGDAQNYSGFRSVIIKNPTPQPAQPDLDEGMIPVTISADGTVTTISENDTNWYDYTNKEWANVVLVTDDTRDTYKDTTGVTVSETDILAYYVWMPRYKYKVWTTGVSSTGSEKTIDIVFEDADEAMSSGTTIGSYRTHPAFWWDNDSDGVVDTGETVSGIWVGKFETTGDATTPTIKPNVASLRSQNVSTQFSTSQKFSTNGNVYGLSSTSTNAHMMKNSEWGAVVYLSHSIYGIKDEVRINNYWDNNATLTGCGAATENEKQSNTCGILYGNGINEYPQSTTRNISGVFDMSGGAWEYVMGHYGTTITENDYSGFTAMPAKKYYDLYSTSEFTGDGAINVGLCSLETCGGHALNETNMWYGNNAHFVHSLYPWFTRGGKYNNNVYAGAFLFSNYGGNYSSVYSWRSTIIVGFGA